MDLLTIRAVDNMILDTIIINREDLATVNRIFIINCPKLQWLQIDKEAKIQFSVNLFINPALKYIIEDAPINIPVV